MTETINIERAVIEVNGGCNYSCEMCPQTNPGRHKGFLKRMKIDMFEDIVKQCAEREHNIQSRHKLGGKQRYSQRRDRKS